MSHEESEIRGRPKGGATSCWLLELEVPSGNRIPDQIGPNQPFPTTCTLSCSISEGTLWQINMPL